MEMTIELLSVKITQRYFHAIEGGLYNVLKCFAIISGWAVVTENEQALWTDGRYFLEAEDTLDCNWILMRRGKLQYEWTSLR